MCSDLTLAANLVPVATGEGGRLDLAGALVLGAGLVTIAVLDTRGQVWTRRMFQYSIATSARSSPSSHSAHLWGLDELHMLVAPEQVMERDHDFMPMDSRWTWLADLAIAAATLVGTLAIMSHGIGHGLGVTRGGHDLDAGGTVLAILASLPLVVWRRAPLGTLVVTSSAASLAAGFGYALVVPLGPTAALYLLAASRSPNQRWSLVTTVAVTALFCVYVAGTGVATRAIPADDILHTGLAWAVSWFAGERTRLLRERMADLEERVRHAEREGERERQLAVAEERARIARDLHDAAGHAINVIAVHAGAGRLRHKDDPARSLAALEIIEELARKTAAEIDAIVHSLRDKSEQHGPAAPPGLASLGALLADHSRTGLEVRVHRCGEPKRLGHAADQAAYRILQEALTNAARHGEGTAEIQLTYGDFELEMLVTNHLAQDVTKNGDGGHGLVGMQERAGLLGGTVDARPQDGEFRVLARIPYGGDAA